MTRQLLPLIAIAALASPGLVNAATTVVYSKTVSLGMIPDDDWNGLASQILISSTGIVTSIEVSLVTEGGWNSDLYAYLEHDGVISVLLNRPGIGDGTGESSSGLNVTFTDSALGDIHTGLAMEFGVPASGTYQPDGRAADPLEVSGLSPRSLYLSGFNGQLAGGAWTLFIADVAGGDEAVLKSWSLSVTSEVSAVPEPGGLVPLGALCAAGLLVRSRKASGPVVS
jgi:subtilisin-like proprotein convertase family protein